MSKPKFKKLKRRDRWLSLSWEACLLAAMIVLVWSYAAVAKPPATATLPAGAVQQNWQVTADTIWVLFTGCLVFFMNAGFCMLETGFCRHKNAVSILAQTFIVFALVTVAYWATGFGLMFGFGGDLSNAKATDNGFIGLHGFFLDERDNGVFRSLNWTDVPVYAKFFFQLVFADTAVTIFTGAVAERIKFIAFFIFSLLLGGLSYPITGHWIWGDGWLAKLGFYDFAGSTVVHSVGGWAGLVGASLLGPRIGRYALFRSRINGDTTDRQAELVGFLCSRNRYISVEKLGSDNPRIDGRVRNEQDVEVKTIDIPTHNFSIATLGCLILWLGWFGFNPGSTMKADPNAIAHIVMTTNMAASTGGIAATITSWVYFGKPNLSMILNGVLAGLVSITASCAFVNVFYAAVIGLVAGTIVVFSVVFIDRLRIDDPVGAISVHLVCGIWGTLAVGLFSAGPLGYSHWYQGSGPKPGLLVGGGLNQLSTQLVGVLAVGAFTAVFSWFAWSVIKATVGLRVELKAELDGLDVSEHGAPAYGGFVVEQDAPEIAIRSLQANQRPPSPRN